MEILSSSPFLKIWSGKGGAHYESSKIRQNDIYGLFMDFFFIFSSFVEYFVLSSLPDFHQLAVWINFGLLNSCLKVIIITSIFSSIEYNQTDSQLLTRMWLRMFIYGWIEHFQYSDSFSLWDTTKTYKEVYLQITLAVGPLSANPTKWSNTIKQFVGKKKLHARCLTGF